MFFRYALAAFAALASTVVASPQGPEIAATCTPYTVTETYVSYVTVYPTSTAYATIPSSVLVSATAPYPTGSAPAPWGTTGTGTGYYYPTGTGLPTSVPPPFNAASASFNGNAVVAALVAVGAVAALL